MEKRGYPSTYPIPLAVIGLLSATLLFGCNSSGSSSNADPDDPPDEHSEPAPPDDGQTDDGQTDNGEPVVETGVLTPLASRMQLVEVGDSEPMHIDGFRFIAIGPQGDISYQTTFRAPVDSTFLGGKQTAFLLPRDGSEPEPYFSALLDMPGYPGYTQTGNPTVHGPAADGSIVAVVTLENGNGEIDVAYRYHDGEYQLLFDSHDIPGLSDHRLADVSNRAQIARNDSGEMAMLLALRDGASALTRVWFRGDADGIEPVLEQGDTSPETDLETGAKYVFDGTFSRPVINNAGEMSFYFIARAEMPDDHEFDIKTIPAIWALPPDADEPEIRLQTRQDFVDQSSGSSRTVGNFINAGQSTVMYSVTDEGDVAVVHETVGDDRRREVLLRTSEGIHVIASENGVAPNVDQVGLASGAVFTRIENVVLSNSGHLSFYAQVDGKTSLWISDGKTTYPVAIEEMVAPELDNNRFANVVVQPGANPSQFGNPPLINNTGQVVFWAELETEGESDTRESLWSYDPCHGLSLIAAAGQSVDLEGLTELTAWEDGEPTWEVVGPRTRTINSLQRPSFARYPANGPNVGHPQALNDQGDFVFIGSLDGDVSVFSFDEEDIGAPQNQAVLLKTRLAACPSDD